MDSLLIFPWWDKTTRAYICGLSFHIFFYDSYLKFLRGRLGCFLKSDLLLCWSVLVGWRSSLPWGGCPRYSRSWKAMVPLGDLAGFAILAVLCMTTGLCRVLRVFCPVPGILWSGFDLVRQGFFQVFSSAVKMTTLEVPSCSAQA